MYKIKIAQVDKERIFPWGTHGSIIKSGDHSITDIELLEAGMLIISATNRQTGQPAKFAVKDWVTAEFTPDVAPVEAKGIEIKKGAK